MKPFVKLFLSATFSLSVILFTIIANSQDEENQVNEVEPGLKEVQVPYDYQNIQVPREVWQTIKDILKKEGADESTLDSFAVIPVAVNVTLTTEHKVVLKDGFDHRITYVEGGGDLDLFSYVTGRGPFNIRFTPQLSGDKPYHLLYVSDSPGKEMNGRFWGNQCGRIYDLSDKFDQFVFDKGIPVTSSRRHYLHLMAGTYLFFQLVEGKLFLSYIRLLDSRYPNFNCR